MIENYAKNILRFRVTEPGGRELRPAQVRKQAWRIDTKGMSRVVSGASSWLSQPSIQFQLAMVRSTISKSLILND